MAKVFKLGNFFIKEIIYGVASDFNTNDILYTLDQLTNASIEISSDSNDITDKHGNIVRSVYQSKTGTFSSTSALLSPALLNAQSGSNIQVASVAAPLEMPRIAVIGEGLTYVASDIASGAVPKVIGLYNNGANDPRPITQGTAAEVTDDGITFKYDTTSNTITLPEKGTDDYLPDKYLIKYQRNVTNGATLVNTASDFPPTEHLTLYAAVGDPCEGKYKAAYIYIPSFQPDPSVTINLDTENQETDFNGNIQIDYCGSDKVLYYIYFPDENAVTTVATTGTTADALAIA